MNMTLKQARDQIHAFATAAARTDDPRSHYVQMNVLVMDDWWKAIDVELARQSEGVSDELPDDIRVPLDEVIADLNYLFGRVAADGSFGQAAADSMRMKLERVRAALTAVLHNRPAQDAFVAHPSGDGCIVRKGSRVRLTTDEILAAMNNQPAQESPFSLAEALSALENWALQGNVLSGDDVPRFRALADRIAPVQEKAEPVAFDEAVKRAGERACGAQTQVPRDLSPGKAWEWMAREMLLAAGNYTAPPAERVRVPEGIDPDDAYAAGWKRCALWADRDDLIADIDSPAYSRDLCADINALSAETEGDHG